MTTTTTVKVAPGIQGRGTQTLGESCEVQTGDRVSRGHFKNPPSHPQMYWMRSLITQSLIKHIHIQDGARGEVV